MLITYTNMDSSIYVIYAHYHQTVRLRCIMKANDEVENLSTDIRYRMMMRCSLDRIVNDT